jgi:hypothetical protein
MTRSELEQTLAQFTGTENWYAHSFVKGFTYTDGVRWFASNAGESGAYWLIDLLATEFYPLLKTEPVLVITVSVENGAAVINATDGNERIIKTKKISYTDLQEGEWTYYLIDDVLLLPSEY